MTQPRMDFAQDEILPRDTHVTEPSEIVRLTGQNAALLARMRRGPATRREMGTIALNVTARVSDIRAALRPHGESLEVVEEHPNGLTIYDLVKWPEWGEEQARKRLAKELGPKHNDCDCGDCRPWTT